MAGYRGYRGSFRHYLPQIMSLYMRGVPTHKIPDFLKKLKVDPHKGLSRYPPCSTMVRQILLREGINLNPQWYPDTPEAVFYETECGYTKKKANL